MHFYGQFSLECTALKVFIRVMDIIDSIEGMLVCSQENTEVDRFLRRKMLPVIHNAPAVSKRLNK